MTKTEIRKFMQKHPACSDPKVPEFMLDALESVKPQTSFECLEVFSLPKGRTKNKAHIWAVYRRDVVWPLDGKEFSYSDTVAVIGTLFKTNSKKPKFELETELQVTGPYDINIWEHVHRAFSSNDKTEKPHFPVEELPPVKPRKAPLKR